MKIITSDNFAAIVARQHINSIFPLTEDRCSVVVKFFDSDTGGAPAGNLFVKTSRPLEVVSPPVAQKIEDEEYEPVFSGVIDSYKKRTAEIYGHEFEPKWQQWEGRIRTLTLPCAIHVAGDQLIIEPDNQSSESVTFTFNLDTWAVSFLELLESQE